MNDSGGLPDIQHLAPLPRLYQQLIRKRYGTYRGLIRLQLALLEVYTGRVREFISTDLQKVDRLVFVCSGNVCRSPYAELIAREENLPCASFGLSTGSGNGAFEDAITTAAHLGRDLTFHRTTSMRDFEIREGDLLLAVEVRHARQLRERIGNHPAQIGFLGCWARPQRPHIHDPMNLSTDYFRFCYEVIDSAVRRLGAEWRASRP